MVEPQPSKLMMWVRFPSPAPDGGPHSSAVEHFLGKEEVTGSSPVVGSKCGFGEVRASPATKNEAHQRRISSTSGLPDTGVADSPNVWRD